MRRTLQSCWAVAVAVALAVTLAACGRNDGDGSQKATAEARVISGLMTDLEFGDKGPDDLRTFVVVGHDGSRTLLHIDPNHDYGFALSHLREHEAQQLPVTVDAEKRADGDWYALDIRD